MMRERDLAAKNSLPHTWSEGGAWQEVIREKNTKIIKRDIWKSYLLV